jgi:hypothetical protein
MDSPVGMGFHHSIPAFTGNFAWTQRVWPVQSCWAASGVVGRGLDRSEIETCTSLIRNWPRTPPPRMPPLSPPAPSCGGGLCFPGGGPRSIAAGHVQPFTLLLSKELCGTCPRVEPHEMTRDMQEGSDLRQDHDNRLRRTRIGVLVLNPSDLLVEPSHDGRRYHSQYSSELSSLVITPEQWRCTSAPTGVSLQHGGGSACSWALFPSR